MILRNYNIRNAISFIIKYFLIFLRKIKTNSNSFKTMRLFHEFDIISRHFHRLIFLIILN